MGNRAVIAFEDNPDVGIYLHWNGGLESVLAFIDETAARMDHEREGQYTLARLTQTIGDFFAPDYTLSLGIGPTKQLDRDNGNNGTYWLRGLRIWYREYVPECERKRISVGDLNSEELEGYTAIRKILAKRQVKAA